MADDELQAIMVGVTAEQWDIIAAKLQTGGMICFSDGTRYALTRGLLATGESLDCPLCETECDALVSTILYGPRAGTVLEPARCENCVAEWERMEAMFGSGKA